MKIWPLRFSHLLDGAVDVGEHQQIGLVLEHDVRLEQVLVKRIHSGAQPRNLKRDNKQRQLLIGSARNT